MVLWGLSSTDELIYSDVGTCSSRKGDVTILALSLSRLACAAADAGYTLNSVEPNAPTLLTSAAVSAALEQVFARCPLSGSITL